MFSCFVVVKSVLFLLQKLIEQKVESTFRNLDRVPTHFQDLVSILVDIQFVLRVDLWSYDRQIVLIFLSVILALKTDLFYQIVNVDPSYAKELPDIFIRLTIFVAFVYFDNQVMNIVFTACQIPVFQSKMFLHFMVLETYVVAVTRRQRSIVLSANKVFFATLSEPTHHEYRFPSLPFPKLYIETYEFLQPFQVHFIVRIKSIPFTLFLLFYQAQLFDQINVFEFEFVELQKVTVFV